MRRKLVISAVVVCTLATTAWSRPDVALLASLGIHPPPSDTTVPAPARPNPARFYTKIGERADFWHRSSDQIKDKVALYSDIVFIAQPSASVAKMIADDLRSRRDRLNPSLRILRYWRMWLTYNSHSEASYSDEMRLFEWWPDTRNGSRGRPIVDAVNHQCVLLDHTNQITTLVDVSNPALVQEVSRVIGGFIADYDGVYFDMSSWDIYAEDYRIASLAMFDGVNCTLSPFASPNGFADNFLPLSRDFAVEYHRAMQAVIDPGADGSKLHLCNGVPRAASRKDLVYESHYMEILDGCQMDTAFVHQTGARFVRARWKSQLNTVRRWVRERKYFLVKIPWSVLPETARTNALEYGFGSYLMGTDGRYALFIPAFNFVDWDTDLIVAAPLGKFVGGIQVAPAVPYSPHVYQRTFQNGMVYVNADTMAHDVTLLDGAYTDVRRGSTVAAILPMPPASARILIRQR